MAQLNLFTDDDEPTKDSGRLHWRELCRLYGYDPQEIEVVGAWFRQLSARQDIQQLQARLPELDAELLALEAERGTAWTENTRRLAAAEQTANEFERPIRVRHALEHRASEDSRIVGEMATLRVRMAHIENTITQLIPLVEAA